MNEEEQKHLMKSYYDLHEKYYKQEKEIERLNENNQAMQEEMTKTWEENERLKEEVINVRNFIKLRNVNTETEDKALLYNLQLENINKIRYLDYKSRIDKATEYIKNHTIEWVDEQFEVYNVMVKVDEYFNPEHAIWLLNGGDENDN